jgi:hypothetical protein
MPPITRLILFVLISAVLAGCDILGDTEIRPADTKQRPELALLYEHLFREFETTFGHDPRTTGKEGDELARDRIINAANRLVDRTHQEHKDQYEIYLPHINLGGDSPDLGDPVDLEVTLTRDELETLGVIK